MLTASATEADPLDQSFQRSTVSVSGIAPLDQFFPVSTVSVSGTAPLDQTFILPEDFPGYFQEPEPPKITSSPRCSLNESQSLLASGSIGDEVETLEDVEVAEDADEVLEEELGDSEILSADVDILLDMEDPQLPLGARPDVDLDGVRNPVTRRSRVFYHRG